MSVPVSNLFDSTDPESAPRPLADRLRPASLEQVVGQDHLLSGDGPLGRMLAAGRCASVVLWGPPGSGKTTIARLLADRVDLYFEQVSAIHSGVADLKAIFHAARERRREGRGTLLFVDEIHRFNRAQQDSFLPVVEEGIVVLVGATTENPSFELNSALLSRMQVFVLKRLEAEALEELLARAEAATGRSLALTPEARLVLAGMADGDGRFALNLAEEVLALNPAEPLDGDGLRQALHRRAPIYDKGREGHYNLISVLHKAIRGSDADAALYWLARMLAGGEDPLYLARRLVRMAVEDIGLADPQALEQADAARRAYEFLGSPEGELALAQATVYLATAPKSNAVYAAFKASMKRAQATGSLMPPMHALNAPTRLMKDLGYGKDYAYDHDSEQAFAGRSYFPEGMERESYYAPPDRGFEREIAKRLAWWKKEREKRGAGAGEES